MCDQGLVTHSSKYMPGALLMALILVCLMQLVSTSAVAQDDKEVLTVKVEGTVVDDDTGKPITQMMIQAGRIDPGDSKKITWGYSERGASTKSGRFSETIKWSAGWTARIVADGYIPHPIMTEAPEPGTTDLDLVIRLKRGKPIVGRVVDHEGNPVHKASVFPVSPRGLNLYEGQAHDRYMNRIDVKAKSVATDEKGQFKIHAGGATLLAVSTESFDVWTAKIEAESDKELEFKLPAPTKLIITVDIEGADKETEVFYQLLTHLMDGFQKVESTRSLTVKNGNSLELTSLPPGKYQFCRQRMHRYENIGNGAMIDRTFLKLKPGETHELRFVRKSRKHVAGVVRWPKDVELAGVILSVQSLEPSPDPWDNHKYTTTYDSRLIAGKPQVKVIEARSAEFTTEALMPGKYRISVVAYTPMTPAEMRLSGIRRPNFTASEVVTVREMSAPDMLVIELEAAKYD